VVGDVDGAWEGVVDGTADGSVEGAAEGAEDGLCVGRTVGVLGVTACGKTSVGSKVGNTVEVCWRPRLTVDSNIVPP